MSWIKIRTNIANDPRVAEIAFRCELPTPHVVGALVALWSFADQYSLDGSLPFVRASAIEAFAGTTGRKFVDSLEAVGWLRFDHERNHFELPRFGEHNGETAKARANGARRQQRFRDSGNAESVTDGNGGPLQHVTHEPSLEKRREEKNRERGARARKGGGL